MADSERDVLDADEIAELRAAPMLVHTYDAHRLVRLLAAAQPSAEPGLDVAWAEAEALTGGVGSIKVQRWAWNVPHPFMVQYRNDDYVGATPTDALRALAAALAPDRPTPGPEGGLDPTYAQGLRDAGYFVDKTDEARDEATYWRRQAIEAEGREGA